MYPSVILRKEFNKLNQQFNLDNDALSLVDSMDSRKISRQLALFWQFLGDTTHHSEFVMTPFGFFSRIGNYCRK